ncbi:diguanylate cyclase [Bermanella marisrubri]|uniref:diguanylate cyclase n=1 Tax=Bermanella marisrubri TaxID=207949 RepID=Q1N062_9GAMM|nr:GGDEF domain-containing protein [Bermanella marisrubri]EAT11655.1 PAS:GGDEF protein [Oceanobacter sp. RED65] [Bermanella marisrubri]QIZ83305.1 diguanylate cyclase [Bermanella marisrubri]
MTAKKISPITQGVSGVDPKYKESFDKVAVGLCHVDLNGRFIHVNDFLLDFLGYEEDELLSITFSQISREEDIPESLAWIKKSLSGETQSNFSKVKQYLHKDGHWVWAKLSTTLIRDEHGVPSYFVSSIQDVSDLKNAETALDFSLQQLNEAYAELEQMSRKDGLTGALNIRAFKEELLDAMERYHRSGQNVTLVFIDLDDFKQVNDQYGHIVGDEVLTTFAKTLLNQSRRCDAVARYGGDEFAMLLDDTTEQEALDFCKRLGSEIEFETGNGKTKSMSFSFGMSQLKKNHRTVEDWFAEADQHMYRDKESSK